MRYELTNLEWSAIKPFLPNKPRGVPRVNDRRVLNGICRSQAKNDATRDQVIIGPLGASALFGGSVENKIAYGIACD